MPDSNMSMPAANIDKAVMISTLDTAAISDADFISFYDSSESVGQPQKKISVGALKEEITGGRTLPPATSADYGRTATVQPDGTFGLGASTVPIFENFVINVSEWVADANVTPFGYSVSKATTETLGVNDAVELINNDPYIFSKYGINLDARGASLKFLAVERPTELLVLRCRIWRNQ